MSFSIREADTNDVSAIASLRAEAFKNDPIIDYVDFTDSVAFRPRWLKTHLDGTHTTLVAVSDESEQVIGFIQYAIHDDDNDRAMSAPEPRQKVAGWKDEWMNEESSRQQTPERQRLATVALETIKAAADRNLAEYDRWIYVNYLGVSPAFQGKGVGKTLMRRVHSLAKERGYTGYLEASDVGLPVYLKRLDSASTVKTPEID